MISGGRRGYKQWPGSRQHFAKAMETLRLTSICVDYQRQVNRVYLSLGVEVEKMLPSCCVRESDVAVRIARAFGKLTWGTAPLIRFQSPQPSRDRAAKSVAQEL